MDQVRYDFGLRHTGVLQSRSENHSIGIEEAIETYWLHGRLEVHLAGDESFYAEEIVVPGRELVRFRRPARSDSDASKCKFVPEISIWQRDLLFIPSLFKDSPGV